MSYPVWAGNVPISLARSAPVPDPALIGGIEVPGYLAADEQSPLGGVFLG